MSEIRKVVAVNFGTKYSKEYTDRLYNMVSRNTTQPFEFYVLTDNIDLYPDYKTVDISNEEEKGWWSKLLMFKEGMLPDGKYLYLDLDVVIVDNIDSLFDLPTFGILRDFIRPDNGLLPGKEYNSSVMLFEPQKFRGIYTFYTQNKPIWVEKQKEIHFFGDQNVISYYLNQFPSFCHPIPDSMCWSYKKGVHRGVHAGDRSRMFGERIPPGGKICVFHGTPNPTEVNANWVKEHYK